jgi:Tfp pilus assembly major pilin PilA
VHVVIKVFLETYTQKAGLITFTMSSTQFSVKVIKSKLSSNSSTFPCRGIGYQRNRLPFTAARSLCLVRCFPKIIKHNYELDNHTLHKTRLTRGTNQLIWTAFETLIGPSYQPTKAKQKAKSVNLLFAECRRLSLRKR